MGPKPRRLKDDGKADIRIITAYLEFYSATRSDLPLGHWSFLLLSTSIIRLPEKRPLIFISAKINLRPQQHRCSGRECLYNEHAKMAHRFLWFAQPKEGTGPPWKKSLGRSRCAKSACRGSQRLEGSGCVDWLVVLASLKTSIREIPRSPPNPPYLDAKYRRHNFFVAVTTNIDQGTAENAMAIMSFMWEEGHWCLRASSPRLEVTHCKTTCCLWEHLAQDDLLLVGTPRSRRC
jgi:hypothetical protein